ncbi:MAG: magnesium transporter CorA family protein [Clostridia bacterium]|nr:magnesium transporter CorA family protein [Clostridia bacterium]
MIEYYKNIDNRLRKIDMYEKGCWICCIDPNEEESNRIINDFNVEPEFLRASLDSEETPHIDSEENNTLIVIDIPIVERVEKDLRYYTMPLGIIITDSNVITVSLKETPIISEFTDGAVKNADPSLKTRFVFNILLKISTKYLQYLKQMEKKSDVIEQELRKTMKNKDLLELFEVEKSLVYFSYSLKSDEGTLEKIRRGRILKLYEDDEDLLEDILIEIKQAIDMSAIHLNILSSTAEAFGSIISNNLNVVMKVLASVTLIVSIPTVISGIYGMNTPDLPFMDYWWVPMILTVLLMIIVTIILRKKDML